MLEEGEKIFLEAPGHVVLALVLCKSLLQSIPVLPIAQLVGQQPYSLS